MAKKGAKNKQKEKKQGEAATEAGGKSEADIVKPSDSDLKPTESRMVRLAESHAEFPITSAIRLSDTPSIKIAKSREMIRAWSSMRNVRSSTLITSTASLAESGSGSLSSISLELKKKPSIGKQKKKKGKKAEIPEKKGKEKREKKEELVVSAEDEKREVEHIPAAADAVPSFNTILLVVKRMKEAEEVRRLQDEAKLKAFAEAEAEREAARLAALAPPKSGKRKKADKGEAPSEKKPKEKKAKKGPKKKLTKKERVKLEAERAEQARIEAEEAAVRAVEEERLARIAEMKALREKDKRELLEHGFRCEQLQLSCGHIKNIVDYNFELGMEAKRQQEWNQYLKCDGLPDPSSCPQMNTYLHLWDKKILETDIDDAATRSREIIKLLDVLDDLIDDAFAVDERQLTEWKWVRLLFRQHQQLSLDTATYRMLRYIETKLHRIDIPTADFHFKDEHFTMYLWLRVQLATPLFNPRKPPKPRIEINFPDMNMNVLFPETFQCDAMAIRGMYVIYDHLSDLSRTYNKPGGVPQHYYDDLYEATLKEWNEKIKYKVDATLKMQQEAEERKQQENTDKADTVSVASTAPAFHKLEPSPSSYVIAVEEIMYSNLREIVKPKIESGELNLRKYVILSGVYHLELFYQPSQPQGLVLFEITITALKIPKCLNEVPYHVTYNPPLTVEGSVRKLPEEIEEEMKRQEQELEKLMLVTLILPTNVMWLDNPVVCHWDQEKQYWSTLDIHDLKHIEEKGYVTFRTGCFGCFAVGVFRYTNLPFQAWELKPEADGSVTLQLTAAILLIDFNVKGNKVCISQIQSNPNNILQDIVGVYFHLPKLRRIMRSCGADVFPEFDTFCYTEGTCEKHWPMERHLYYSIAQLSDCFNFAWSRWNLLAGRRKIVLQMREYKPNRPKQPQHTTLLVTPLKAIYVNCTEVSQVFSEEGIEGMKFYADLYHLMKGTSDMATKKKVQSASLEQVNTVADLLIAIRMLSFS